MEVKISEIETEEDRRDGDAKRERPIYDGSKNRTVRKVLLFLYDKRTWM